MNSNHKFEIGDRVNFVPAFHQKSSMASDFEIVRCLPDFNGEFFYRIKSSAEPHERVVGESQLRQPPVPTPQRVPVTPSRLARAVKSRAKAPSKAASKVKSRSKPKAAARRR